MDLYIYIYMYNLTTVDQYYIITVKHYKTISYCFTISFTRSWSACVITLPSAGNMAGISIASLQTALALLQGTQELDCFLCPTPEVLCGIPKPRVWAWVKQVACVGPLWPTRIIRHIGVDVENASWPRLPIDHCRASPNEFDQWIPVVSANIFWNNLYDEHACLHGVT